MTVPVGLALSGDQHEHLKSFLFPGDGKEAVALLLCGRRAGDRRERLVVREIHGVPYDHCTERTAALVRWRPEYIAPLLDRAADERLSVVKVHSHPSGRAAFSATDDEGDGRLLPMIRGWVEADIAHGSAVMLPHGVMFGRVLRSSGMLEPISCIAVSGDDLHFWYAGRDGVGSPDWFASPEKVFGEGTIERMRRLSIAVVGASGTGSPVIEQLKRLEVGETVIVDDDHMEQRNVIRVLNSTMQDVNEKRLKVDVQADAIERVGLGSSRSTTQAEPLGSGSCSSRGAMRRGVRMYGQRRRAVFAERPGHLLHVALLRYRSTAAGHSKWGLRWARFERCVARSTIYVRGGRAC